MTYAIEVIVVNRTEYSFHKLWYCKKDNEEPSSCVRPVWFWQGTGEIHVSLCVCANPAQNRIWTELHWEELIYVSFKHT